MRIWSRVGLTARNMAEPRVHVPCVPRELFYKQLDALKNKQTKNESQVTLFIEDSFFDKAKAYLKYQTEMQLGIQSKEPMLSKWEKSTVIRKEWAYSDNSIITQNKRKVVPKRDIHNVLSPAHNHTAHSGSQITSKWISNNYSEVNVKVVAIFVGLCPIHAEQQSVTSRVKLVDKPIQSPTFIRLLEIDLMDFRNCPCDCTEKHTWAMNITDHHTKYVYVTPLKAKSANEVLTGFKRYCYIYGFLKKILADNGREFANKKMEAFCEENHIQVAHGSPQTPTTQGLVERSNRSWKEDMRALIMSISSSSVQKWCEKASEAAYTRNISYHRAIKMTPYEAVYGMKSHRECEHHEEQSKKRQKITVNQEKYNNEMVTQSQKKKPT